MRASNNTANMHGLFVECDSHAFLRVRHRCDVTVGSACWLRMHNVTVVSACWRHGRISLLTSPAWRQRRAASLLTSPAWRRGRASLLTTSRSDKPADRAAWRDGTVWRHDPVWRHGSLVAHRVAGARTLVAMSPALLRAAAAVLRAARPLAHALREPALYVVVRRHSHPAQTALELAHASALARADHVVGDDDVWRQRREEQQEE